MHTLFACGILILQKKLDYFFFIKKQADTIFLHFYSTVRIQYDTPFQVVGGGGGVKRYHFFTKMSPLVFVVGVRVAL